MDHSDSRTVENHRDLQHCVLPALHTGLCSINDHFPVLPEAKTCPLQRAKPQCTSTILKNNANSHSSQREWSPYCPQASILTVLWPLGGLGLPLWQGGELSSFGKTAQTWEAADQNKSAWTLRKNRTCWHCGRNQLSNRFLTGDFMYLCLC